MRLSHHSRLPITDMVASGRSAQAHAQVLIIDDNEDASMSLTMLFELEDIPAIAAADAASALVLAQETSPRLLLVDIGLPDMNGVDLARRLRQMPGTSKSTYIALTGSEEGGAGLADVFDQYWTKPFDPKKLLAEVKAIVATSAD